MFLTTATERGYCHIDVRARGAYPDAMADRATEFDQHSRAGSARTAIGIGVTGHRLARLDASQLPALSASVAKILDDIAASLAAAPGGLRLLTSLADGADSLVADEALGRGWQVDAVLPFPRDDYGADFADSHTREAYQERLGKSRAILELPGSRADDHGIAYERAGRAVLAQCDVLIAIWDGAAARGRGGAAQIVGEAVLQGIPVIHIDATGVHPPQLLWDGLTEHRLGQQTVETVARSDMTALPKLLQALVDMPPVPDIAMSPHLKDDTRGRWQLLSLAYPLLLAVMGVRALKASDLREPPSTASEAVIETLCSETEKGFGARIAEQLAPRFARADATASAAAQLFRSGYVVNFSFAALAVLLSLLALAFPGSAKPVLVAIEVGVIAAILIVTRAGNRAGWHRRWLDNRNLAERLRCLALSAQLGDLGLRGGAAKRASWIDGYVRATARELGLPNARIDTCYLDRVQVSLTGLIDDQTAYLSAEAHRMHRLEHRLHVFGTWLFGATAVICLSVLAFKLADKTGAALVPHQFADPFLIFATIATAGLPAVGAAIYGIRMQGDFAGTAARSAALAQALGDLRSAIKDDDDGFDTLLRRVRHANGLLTEGLESWLETYFTRPLTLPG